MERLRRLREAARSATPATEAMLCSPGWLLRTAWPSMPPEIFILPTAEIRWSGPSTLKPRRSRLPAFPLHRGTSQPSRVPGCLAKFQPGPAGTEARRCWPASAIQFLWPSTVRTANCILPTITRTPFESSIFRPASSRFSPTRATLVGPFPSLPPHPGRGPSRRPL